MDDNFDEGAYWAGRKYHPSESGSDMVTSDTVTSDAAAAPPAPPSPIAAPTPEVATFAENGDCFVKKKPREAWLAAIFPKSSFATRISAPTTCAAAPEPVVKKPSVVFACP